MMTPLKKRILIIGASGFLGQGIYLYLQKNLCEHYQITGTYCSSTSAHTLEKLDITSFRALEQYLVDTPPDFILLAAGNKNVQECEENFSRAYTLNTQPVEFIISIISQQKLPARLLYLSTDYVFNGRTGQYRDTDLPCPSTNYGKTKYLAEQALLNSNIDYKIIRTAAVMGKGGIFFDWLIDKICNEKEISMYDNVLFSPTPLTFLAEMIARCVENYDHIPQKIIHIVGENRFNRYQFAILVKNILHSDVQIHADKNQDTSTLFQHDLSMIPSDIINTWREKNFENYLKDEILNASVCK
jgi:dTDP-4-dehydrorhamnose reductase